MTLMDQILLWSNSTESTAVAAEIHLALVRSIVR